MYFVIHQATQNLNYGPVMQSQGHQSALFIRWFPGLVFRNLVWCFPIGPRSYLNCCLAANQPHLLQQQLYSVNRYTLKAVLLFYQRNFKLACTAMCVRPCYLGEVEEEIVRRDKKMAWYVPGVAVRLAKDDGHRSCRRRRTSRVGDGAQYYR